MQIEAWQNRRLFLLHSIKTDGIQAQRLQKNGGAARVVSTKLVKIRAWNLGFATSSISFVSSCAKLLHPNDQRCIHCGHQPGVS